MVTRKNKDAFTVQQNRRNQHLSISESKQPLLICCPFTKPTNDSILPSNSWVISDNLMFPGSVCTKNPWNLDPHALYFGDCDSRHIVVNYVCHMWTVHSLMYKETLRIASRVFFTRKSARFYAFRYKSTPSTALPSMLARTKICKRTRSDYRLFSLWFTVPLVFQLKL